MECIELKDEQTIIALSQEELRIILAAVGEIYEGVCVDARDFEAIHGIEKNEVLQLKKELYEIYDQLIDNNEIS
ncbi:hypothetical protein HK18_02880 [Commensalibacter intestini]|uniref:Uncharacterized protein n=1 Tax=Commensalibacter intestini TaxID=479936 RepID=A0A251ZSW9_9PROT|nr:hypothetical protein [Commensalibacter intestini]OUI77767.1 hypothetical protein HK18_02880 [Commensalibacter intestini]